MSRAHRHNLHFPDIPQPQSIMSTKHDVIARFIHVIKPLGEIYKLPVTSLHIFYDQGGDLIAFNRNASIFLNLRYYEAWRELSLRIHVLASTDYHFSIDDSDVQANNLSAAYISWYATPLIFLYPSDRNLLPAGSSLLHTKLHTILCSHIIPSTSSISLRFARHISCRLAIFWPLRDSTTLGSTNFTWTDGLIDTV